MCKVTKNRYHNFISKIDVYLEQKVIWESTFSAKNSVQNIGRLFLTNVRETNKSTIHVSFLGLPIFPKEL